MEKERYLELRKAVAFSNGIAFYSELSPNEVVIAFRENGKRAYERTDVNRAYYKYISPGNQLIERLLTIILIISVFLGVTFMLWINLVNNNFPLLLVIGIVEAIFVVMIEQLYQIRPGAHDNLKRYKIAGGMVSIAYNKNHKIPKVSEVKEFLELFKPRGIGLMYVEPHDEDIELAIFGLKLWYDQEQHFAKNKSYKI